MSHAHHPALPNYVPEAVFHSGCVECKTRSSWGIGALRFLDQDQQFTLFERALKWRTDRHFPIDPLESQVFHDLEVLAGAIHEMPMLLTMLVPPRRPSQ